MPDDEQRPPTPWFGSKRIGWGIRPQTWQGWAVTMGFAFGLIVFVLIIVAIVPHLAGHH